MSMNDEQMLREHKKTFDGFVKISFWFSVHVVILLALMAFFLV
jgi:hypothetical protein